MNENVRAPNYDLAYIDYCKGMKYKEIAEKYGVTINTVKSWKTRYKWSKDGKKGVHTKSKKVCTQNPDKKKPAESEVKSVTENSDLTDKQRLFCIYYIRSFNATKAYQKAYGVDYPTAAANGPRMLRNARVKKEILSLKQERLNREFLSEADIFQKYMDIAFADITDYMEFGVEEVPVMSMHGPVKIENPETKKKEILKKKINVVRFKNSSEVDGTILAEVKQGKDGASIKLADRMKALQWLSDHMNMATEEQKAKVALLQKKIKDDDDGKKDALKKLDDVLKEIGGVI